MVSGAGQLCEPPAQAAGYLKLACFTHGRVISRNHFKGFEDNDPRPAHLIGRHYLCLGGFPHQYRGCFGADFCGKFAPFFDISSGARADGSYPTRMMGGAMSAYWFMYDAAALPSLGAKPRTLP
jgi:hypothetical protein